MNKEKDTKIIYIAALELLVTEGFMRRYEIIASEHDVTFQKAYEMTEAEHVAAFERRRYRNAHNFRKSYNQYLSRKKRNEQPRKILPRQNTED